MSFKDQILPLLGVPTDPSVEAEKPPKDTFGWATVTNLDPLRIRKDGPGDELPMTPEQVGSTAYSVGSRVWCQLHGQRVLILGGSGGTAALIGRASTIMSGGGQRAVNTTGVTWSRRIILMGAGLGPLAPSGFFNIEVPGNGTVIPVHGKTSATDVTVTAGAIPLTGWDVLYYELPLGGPFASVPGNFHVVGYQDPFNVPGSWVPIIGRNNDYQSAPYRWFDGREQDYWRGMPFASGWSNLGSPYELCYYKRERGEVIMQGMCKGPGTSVVANLPAGYLPASILQFITNVSSGYGDVRVYPDGRVSLYGMPGGGTAGSLSLSQIRYTAVQ